MQQLLVSHVGMFRMLSQERPLAVNLPHLSCDKFYQASLSLNFSGKGEIMREEGLGTRLGSSVVGVSRLEVPV